MKQKTKKSVIPLTAEDKALIASVAAKLRGKELFPEYTRAVRELFQIQNPSK